jgi:hypothetical protein
VLRGHETGLSVRFTAKIIFSRNGAQARKNGANDFFRCRRGVDGGVFVKYQQDEFFYSFVHFGGAQLK